MADSRESEPEVQQNSEGASDSFRAAEDSAASAFRDELVSDLRTSASDSSSSSNSTGDNSDATHNNYESNPWGRGASSDRQRDSGAQQSSSSDSASAEGPNAAGRKAEQRDANTQEKSSQSESKDEGKTSSKVQTSPAEGRGSAGTEPEAKLDNSQKMDDSAAKSENLDQIGVNPPQMKLPLESNSKPGDPNYAPTGPTVSDAASSSIRETVSNQLEFPDIFTAEQLGQRHRSDTKPDGKQEQKTHEVKNQIPDETPDIIGMRDSNAEQQKPSEKRATERELPTGDTIEKRSDGTQILKTPAGDKLQVNPDGSFSVEGKVNGISHKGEFTEINFADGAVVTMDKKGILTVERADQAVAFSRLSDRERRPEPLKK